MSHQVANNKEGKYEGIDVLRPNDDDPNFQVLAQQVLSGQAGPVLWRRSLMARDPLEEQTVFTMQNAPQLLPALLHRPATARRQA